MRSQVYWMPIAPDRDDFRIVKKPGRDKDGMPILVEVQKFAIPDGAKRHTAVNKSRPGAKIRAITEAATEIVSGDEMLTLDIAAGGEIESSAVAETDNVAGVVAAEAPTYDYDANTVP